MTSGWSHALANYDFAMRVDDDVCLQHFESPPFSSMRRKELVYGYGARIEEKHNETVDTMRPWLEQRGHADILPVAGLGMCARSMPIANHATYAEGGGADKADGGGGGGGALGGRTVAREARRWRWWWRRLRR